MARMIAILLLVASLSVCTAQVRVELTRAQALMVEDRRQLDSDSRLNLPKKDRDALLRGDRDILSVDKAIRNVEVKHDEIVSYNKMHPDNLEADVTGVIAGALAFRKKLVDEEADFRKSLLSAFPAS
jgi:hypothetical protein